MKFKNILVQCFIFFAIVAILIGIHRGIDRLVISRTRPKEINVPAINPQSTIFAFDLHDVVVDISRRELFMFLLKSLSRRDIWRVLMSPRSLWAVFNLSREYGLSEQEYDQLSEQYPILKKIKPGLLAMIDLQKIDAKTLALVHELATKGYSIYIASNIWPSSLQRLRVKFPELDQYFNGFFIAPDKARKPHHQFYQAFRQSLRSDGNKQSTIIFIDDSGKNVIAANRAGMYGIRFQKARKLAKKLKKLGIA